MRCLFAALVILVFFFNEIESSGMQKKAKLSNGSSSKRDGDKINLRAIPKRPAKPDKRRPKATFQPTEDPEEIYQLYKKYYTGRNDPPASSGYAALELYHRHFTNPSKDLNYDHYGRLAPRIALEDALINYKKPLGQHPHPSDSKSSAMPKKLKLQSGSFPKEDEDKINLYDKYYAGRTEHPASSASSAMPKKAKLQIRSSPKEDEDRIKLYEKYYAGRAEPPASSGKAALELYHQHFADETIHSDHDTYGSFAPTVVQQQPRANFEQPLGQHPGPPDSKQSSTSKRLRVNDASSSKKDQEEMILKFTPRFKRKPDKRSPEVTFKHSTDPEETYNLYTQYYADHNEPRVLSGNPALDLYLQCYGKITDTVTLEKAGVNLQESAPTSSSSKLE